MKSPGVFALGFPPRTPDRFGHARRQRDNASIGARGGDGELLAFRASAKTNAEKIDIGLIDIEDGYTGPPFAERLLNGRKPLALAGSRRHEVGRARRQP